MEVSYTLILVAVVAQFILGALWYSPLLFGKWWMQIMECEGMSKAQMQKMQKEMMPFYGLQFLLTLLSTVSFANLAVYLPGFSIYHVGFWLWVGFLAPTQIASVVWANTKKKFWPKQIFVMLSYQLVGIMLAAFILSL
ncbi:MAG: DUF1761 domain-containing protein [bacterium]